MGMDAKYLQDLFLTFGGRLNRQPYWLGYLAIFATLVIVGAGPVYFLGPGEGATIWIVVVVFVCAVAGAAISVKRLHDRGKSSWWLLLFYVVPGLLSSFAGRSVDGSNIWWMLTIALFTVSVWGLVEMGFLRGGRQANKYGPDPLANSHLQPPS